MPTKRQQEFMDSKHGVDKKASKPLMEKRRRARINHSLAQLKSLVIDPNTLEKTRQAKLEKADILEMTVRHLHDIKRMKRSADLVATHPKQKFEMGYTECVKEVDFFLSKIFDSPADGTETELQRKLKDHLSRKLQDIKTVPGDNSSDSNSNEDVPVPFSEKAITPEENENFNGVFQSNESSLSAIPHSYPKRKSKLEQYLSETDRHNTQHVNNSTILRSPCYQSTIQNEQERDCSSSPCSSSSASSAGKDNFASSIENQTIVRSYENISPSNLEVSKSLTTHNGCYQRTSNVPQRDMVHSTVNEQDNLSNFYQGHIPLVPRRLPNGEWALVLPGNFFQKAEDDSSNRNSVFKGMIADDHVKRHRTSSPLSSGVSDLSCDDYVFRVDDARMEQDEQYDSSHDLWRPW